MAEPAQVRCESKVYKRSRSTTPFEWVRPPASRTKQSGDTQACTQHIPIKQHEHVWETHLHIPAHTGTQCILTLILYTYIYSHLFTHLHLCIYTSVCNPYTCICPKQTYMESVKSFSVVQDRGYNNKKKMMKSI